MRASGIQYIQGRNAYSDADGTKYGIAIHNTSNTASADNEASYATRRTDGVSSHFYADGVKVIQSLDTASRAGHAGSNNGNQHSVAVEITGLNSRSRQWWITNVNWRQLGHALNQVCHAYGIPVRRVSVAEMRANPRVKGFYSHDDMRQAWGGTDHTDPGPNFPWDVLLTSVATGGAPAQEENDMDLNDPVPGTETPGFYNQPRSLKLVLNGLWDLRSILFGEKPIPVGTRLAELLALSGKVEELELGGVDLDVLADKVAARLAPQLPTPEQVAQELARRLSA
jgi:N-acetyl-anhydromuramyl-L-alanine amidase AmpD